MIAGARLWMSVILMCIASAMLSLRQTVYIGDLQSHDELNESEFDEWAPMINRRENTDGGVGGMADFREPKDGAIKSISLLGERSSGTRWIYGHLGLCFNHTIPVHRSLSRYKHWFQYDDASKIPSDTLSIAMFRDPMTWTWAMKAVPHHAPAHIDLPWDKFVTKEWTTERLYKDEAWRDEQMKLNKAHGRICQEDFHYHEIVSCLIRPYPEGFWGTHRKHRFSQHQPFYEMRVNDPKGRPYKNILEMRADKIRNFVESAAYSNVEGFWHFQYESLLKTGTKELVENIERATGVKRHPGKCKIYEPQDRRKREMDPEFLDYMADHVDWTAEALIGYRKPEHHATNVPKISS
mmetsp:Transcript_8987/g.21874  ORF Transcript_8987/g.21874 Transcript_8987/m.21874 type:complete len:351 (-) Transcript_8987:318-1370(-)|eukprot:CAMPEP_0181096916 /NCGR_PEP_ID=MMETSP1071-20121207/11284_1 /TAXON_ID=35127 /ORGANISM="Thalassiosira sp., Strain NH16" /LENGTH=350 /DNA_ID=CAMNT_0023179349 /DNA_START=83 /DNA_END=1135 /DNA_ORIENTATION=+